MFMLKQSNRRVAAALQTTPQSRYVSRRYRLSRRMQWQIWALLGGKYHRTLDTLLICAPLCCHGDAATLEHTRVRESTSSRSREHKDHPDVASGSSGSSPASPGDGRSSSTLVAAGVAGVPGMVTGVAGSWCDAIRSFGAGVGVAAGTGAAAVGATSGSATVALVLFETDSEVEVACNCSPPPKTPHVHLIAREATAAMLPMCAVAISSAVPANSSAISRQGYQSDENTHHLLINNSSTIHQLLINRLLGKWPSLLVGRSQP